MDVESLSARWLRWDCQQLIQAWSDFRIQPFSRMDKWFFLLRVFFFNIFCTKTLEMGMDFFPKKSLHWFLSKSFEYVQFHQVKLHWSPTFKQCLECHNRHLVLLHRSLTYFFYVSRTWNPVNSHCSKSCTFIWYLHIEQNVSFCSCFIRIFNQ